jgi:glycosyltransferase involved in cell wall biosynthesis
VRRKVIVLAPSRQSPGGVSEVLNIIFENWQSGAYELRQIDTQLDGGSLRKAWMALRAMMAYLAALARGDADLVHIHFAAGASIYRKSAFILISRLFGIPVVAHAHAGMFPAFYRSRGRLGKNYIRFVLGRLQRLIVLSGEWVNFYQDLCPRVAIVVVPNHVVLPAVADRVRARERPPIVLTLGRLGRNKGTYDLLQVIPAILREFPDAEFWFGGDGEVEIVRRQVEQEPWADHVRLLGWVSGRDKEKAFQQCSLFVLPSYAEGMPMAVLEAMSYGLPVVATPVGGVPQIVAGNRTGLLVPPGDTSALAEAILRVLREPEMALALGNAARAVVCTGYDARHLTERLTEVYGSVLNELTTRRTAHPRRI